MIQFQRLTSDDIDMVERLYREYLDNGTMLRERIEEVFIERGTIGCKAVDSETGEIAGIIIDTRGIAFSVENEELTKKVADYVGDADVYTGEALLVTHKYRGMNLAVEMTKKIKEYMYEEKEKTGRDIYMLHEMWVYPDGKTPAYKSVNEIYGITEDLGIVKHFYKDYYKQGHLCPVCGKNCICSARITLSKI